MVPRYKAITYKGFDQYGNEIDRDAEGFHARVVQHECDHLDGVLYVDKADTRTLSFLKEFRRYAVNEEEMEE